jgi:hypothetical protein
MVQHSTRMRMNIARQVFSSEELKSEVLHIQHKLRLLLNLLGREKPLWHAN